MFRVVMSGQKETILILEFEAIKQFVTTKRKHGYNVGLGGTAPLTDSPEIVRRVTKGVRAKFANDPEFSKKHSERLRLMTSDPEGAFAKGRAASKESEQWLKSNREHMARLHADPVFSEANRERSRERMTRMRKDPGFIAARAAAIKSQWDAYRADPENVPKPNQHKTSDVRNS